MSGAVSKFSLCKVACMQKWNRLMQSSLYAKVPQCEGQKLPKFAMALQAVSLQNALCKQVKVGSPYQLAHVQRSLMSSGSAPAAVLRKPTEAMGRGLGGKPRGGP